MLEKITNKIPILLRKSILVISLLMSFSYSGVLTIDNNISFDTLTINSDDKVIVSSNVILTTTGSIHILGELEMADGSTVETTGGYVDIESLGILDMGESSTLEMEGNLILDGTLEADPGSRIILD